uniref:Interleukin-4 n=1 Tax=Loxodonta africana TaxID=9785 RepID=G3T4B8_LOXAF
MGLTSQLIPTLLCLLVCTSNFIHGQTCGNILREIIKTLNFLTEKKHACTELTVADAFAAPKNTTEKETFCRATTVLWQVSKRHECFTKYLRGLSRSLSSMTNLDYCPVNEDRNLFKTARVIEKLKTIYYTKFERG